MALNAAEHFDPGPGSIAVESLDQSHRVVPALGFKRRIHENRILGQRFLGECATLAVIRCVPHPDVRFHCSSRCRNRQLSLTCCVNSNQFIEPLFWLNRAQLCSAYIYGYWPGLGCSPSAWSVLGADGNGGAVGGGGEMRKVTGCVLEIDGRLTRYREPSCVIGIPPTPRRIPLAIAKGRRCVEGLTVEGCRQHSAMRVKTVG